MELDTGLQVAEDERVYQPAEDSHLLLRGVELDGASTFLEVGTGTGLIALHATRQVPSVATDINPHAVALCRENARANGLPLEVVRADLFQGLRGPFDVIVFNPPYLPVRPRGEWLDRAWSGGQGGDEVIRRFLREASRFLTRRGRIYILLSSRNRNALRVARTNYLVERLDEEPLFFERIVTYRLHRRA